MTGNGETLIHRFVDIVRGVVLSARETMSIVGVLLGTLFFAASLTPTLLPRTAIMQGALSGVSFAAGYGIGVFCAWLWSYLGIRTLEGRPARYVLRAAALVCLAVVAVFLWRAAGWQNSIRLLMELEPLDTAQPLRIGLIAFATAAVTILLGKLFRLALLAVAGRLKPVVPRRVANVAGAVAALVLFWVATEGLVLRYGLRAVDASFRELDRTFESGVEKPPEAWRTGSAASLVRWSDLGRAGRGFVDTAPSRADIAALAGGAAMDPLRVYVGLNSAATIEERASLALAELLRVGAFERSALVVVTPTGTGWIDPAAMDTLEILHRGDVASVALQYSYLTSWLSLLVEPGYGKEAARALFRKVYEHWRQMPRDARPALYLYGLSLGALNSDLSFDMFDIVGDPFQGILWSGPPFQSRTWRAATAEREPGSPAWLPRFRDGSVIRFTSQKDALDIPGASWGPIRIVYLQYASDPVTFFDFSALFRRPPWMVGPRGPDVSPMLQWYPVVTLLQLALDMAAATTAPIGYGHSYAPEHHVDPWVAVTRPPGWDAPALERLKRKLAERRD